MSDAKWLVLDPTAEPDPLSLDEAKWLARIAESMEEAESVKTQ